MSVGIALLSQTSERYTIHYTKQCTARSLGEDRAFPLQEGLRPPVERNGGKGHTVSTAGGHVWNVARFLQGLHKNYACRKLSLATPDAGNFCLLVRTSTFCTACLCRTLEEILQAYRSSRVQTARCSELCAVLRSRMCASNLAEGAAHHTHHAGLCEGPQALP